MFGLAAGAQPAKPELFRAWTASVSPKIEAHLKRGLQARHIRLYGKSIIVVRAYLEKNGSLKKLRINPAEVQSDLPKPELTKLEEALLAAVKQSTPLPYSSAKESRLPHLGFVLIYETKPEKLIAEITMPEDHPDIPVKP